MQSFHRSRGRIFFEVLCAFTISASCAGAWLQTGAWALLVTSSVVALYGVVQAFDLVRRNPADAVEPQRIMFQPGPEIDVPASQVADAPIEFAADQQLTTDNVVNELRLVEPVAPPAKAGGPAKSSRKGGGRRSSARKDAKIAELTPPEEEDATELALPAAAEVAVAVDFDEAAHISHAPLFEPAPFVRQQRAAFGRKAG
jgi:hypothetical protein